MAHSPNDLSAEVAELRRHNEALAQRQRVLEAEGRHFQALFALCPCALLMTDAAGLIRQANRAAAELLGQDSAALAARPVAHLLTAAGGRLKARPLAVPDGQTDTLLWQVTAEPALSGEARFLVAGLSHEARNILQRGQAALERLQWRLQDQPEALDLLARLQRTQDDQARLYETLRDYLAPLTLSRAPHDLGEIWREAWGRLTTEQPRRDAQLTEEAEGADLLCEVDRSRLTLALRYLLFSALTACPDPARLILACRALTPPEGPALRLMLRDNGPPLSVEQRQQLFEPFAGPKARRCGLGLATARKIVEAHGGKVYAADPGGPGVEVVITLPRRGP